MDYNLSLMLNTDYYQRIIKTKELLWYENHF